GFLRMGTTGFVARADGAGDEAEVRTALWRALLLAAGIGAVLILLQWPIRQFSLTLLGGSDSVQALTGAYFSVRIWGAPAILALFALMGILIGLGHSRTLLLLQLFLNGLNILLDIWFAGVLGMGAEGIALGTALAEWSALLFGLWLVVRLLQQRHRDEEAFIPMDRLRDPAPLKATLAANTDIMVRTLLLVTSFAWFTRQGARFGDDVLAANHILLQLISFSAFFLDGFAFVAESLAGQAAGGGRRRRFDIAVRRTTELAIASALLLAVGVLLAGNPTISSLTTHEPVREAAATWLPLASLYIAVSFAAFQLDGIFIGTSRTRQMRNASIVSTSAFLLLSLPAMALAGNTGLWWAFIVFVMARALALGWYYPGLRRAV
ncbi:MAG: MATE family efflux transporter, partial [Pseudomonadota bacterium]